MAFLRGLIGILIFAVAIILLIGLFEGIAHPSGPVPQGNDQVETDRIDAKNDINLTVKKKQVEGLPQVTANFLNELSDEDFKLQLSVSDLYSKCTVQDPDNIRDITPCNLANRKLRILSSKGICVHRIDLVEWYKCKPGTKIDEVYPGKDMQFIFTKASKFGVSEKVPNVDGMYTRLCQGRIVESDPEAFFSTNDPYSLKEKCYAMSFPAGGKVQWIGENAMLLIPPFPGGRPVILKSVVHPKLGARAIFIGENPIQYQSTLGALETPVTFRMLVYIS